MASKINSKKKTSNKQSDRVFHSTSTFQVSQEELLFLMRLIDLPDIPGVGEKPWGNIDLVTAEQLFKEAGLALEARGLVALDENKQPLMEKTLKEILSACAFPQQMVAIAFSKGKVQPQQLYYYRALDFDVRQTLPQPRVHSFEMIPRSDMGYAEVKGLFEGRNWDFSSAPLQITQNTYNQAQQIAPSDAGEAHRLLNKAGMQADLASALSVMMSSYDLKLMVEWAYQLNPRVNQMTITLLVGESSCWLVENVSLGEDKIVKIKAIDASSLNSMFLRAFQPFDIPQNGLT